MELKSDPNTYETINVTDLDIVFPGDHQSFTLVAGKDSYIEEGGYLYLDIYGGSIKFNMAHAHWSAVKHRTIRVVVPEGQSAQSAVPQPPTPTQKA